VETEEITQRGGPGAKVDSARTPTGVKEVLEGTGETAESGAALLVAADTRLSSRGRSASSASRRPRSTGRMPAA